MWFCVCSSCGQSTGPTFSSSEGRVLYSRTIYPQPAEQQGYGTYVKTDVEVEQKRREVQEEEENLQRILDLRSKGEEELRTLEKSVAEHEQELKSLQSAVTSANKERMRTQREVNDEHVLLSKLRIERHKHYDRLAEDENKLEADKRAFDEMVKAKQRALQEEKNRVDLRMKLWSQKRVRIFRIS